jgi:hypothetical protein
MGARGDVELRIVRAAATLGFFAMVIATAVRLSSPDSAGSVWGYVIGALLFGGMTCFLWRDDLAARASGRTDQQAAENARRYAEKQAGASGAAGSSSPWS